jgi:molybdenum cofactor cytidylyltransferase
MSADRAIILAAGSSRRMGTPKLLLPFGKSTLLETVIKNVLDSDVESALVVLGDHRDEISQIISRLPVELCYNDHHESGMYSSVLCGIDALPADTRAVLVFPGDQPGIPPQVINTLIRKFHETHRGILIPMFNGRRGHPLLVDFKYRDQLKRLDPDQGLRTLRTLFPEDVLEVEVDERGILMDIDTPEDYLKAKNTIS